VPDYPITVTSHDRRIWRIRRHPGYSDEMIATVIANRENGKIHLSQKDKEQAVSPEFAKELATALDQAIAFVSSKAPSPYEGYTV
jgi:hypothetical protein